MVWKTGFLKAYVAVATVIGTAFILTLLFAAGSMMVGASVKPASGQAPFNGILTSAKQSESGARRDKNIVIVHGINSHCIGYADKLISNMSAAAGLDASLFYEEVQGCDRYGDKDDYEGTLIPKMGFECKLIHEGKLSAINGQPEISAFAVNEDYGSIDCFEIDVLARLERGPTPMTVGFVRTVEKPLNDGTKLRFFEVTWSPASHWGKASLQKVHANYGKRDIGGVFNQVMKREIVNSAIADAVAYLGKSGALVNYAILDSLCVVVAKSDPGLAESMDYSPKCSPKDLKAADSFAETNDVYLITHSLGTRVVFDTLGLLAKGLDNGNGNELVGFLTSRFEEIGVIPWDTREHPVDFADAEYQRLLGQAIGDLVESIQSVFVFTNQIPLLYAHIGSPYELARSAQSEAQGALPGKEDFVQDFTKFLDLRKNRGADGLQIVSFHDPDDLLSYDLKCWYQENLLLQNEQAKTLLEEFGESNKKLFAAAERCGEDGICSQNEANKLVRDDLKELGCFADAYAPGQSPDYSQLYEDLWDIQRDIGFDFFSVDVRMNAFRIDRLFADPLNVHSLYFERPEFADALMVGLKD